jgi:tRNA(Ile)-lysidine synthase
MLALRLGAILDQRLDPTSPRPLAVALSGGSDSLALLLLTRAWASANGRSLIVLTVDHGLQAASQAWAARCAALCARLGLSHRILTWTGPKPATGLPAAARAARHALLAEATREAGASVLLLGHTADDLAESAAMRADGSTVPDARQWAPSPAWPEGRGVFLLRPLLEVRRQALRDWLSAQGETWIDDPANDDARYARARARTALSSPVAAQSAAYGGAGPSPIRVEGAMVEGARDGAQTNRAALGLSSAQPEESPPRPSPPPPRFARSPSPVRPSAYWEGWDEAGVVVLARDTSAATLAAACLCAGGSSRPPRGERLTSLLARLAAGETFTATLAGARIEAGPDSVMVSREPGELARSGVSPLALCQDETAVWDGRFEVTATIPGLTLLPLDSHGRWLPKPERAALKTLPAAARRSLPVATDGAGLWTCPILAASPSVRAQALVRIRFEAATGQIVREAGTQPAAERGEVAGGVLS